MREHTSRTRLFLTRTRLFLAELLPDVAFIIHEFHSDGSVSALKAFKAL